MKHALKALIFCAVLISSIFASAQGLPQIAPDVVGLSPDGVRAMDSVMARYTAADRYPAAMLMVARNGKVGYWKAFGVRDLDRRDPLNRNDVFRIFSLTKPITTTAVLMLWEQGKLGLDDPAARYVPPLARLRVQDGSSGTRPPRQPLTIRHLLTFTSGLTYGIWGTGSPAEAAARAAKIGSRAQSLDHLMNLISDLPLVGDPGTIASYGWQMEVLGKIVEVVSGQSLDRFLAEKIFSPLRIRETGFFVPSALLARVPILYNVSEGKAPARATATDWTDAFGAPPKVLWGGGGLYATASDYIRFAQMIANRGELEGVRLLRPATVEMMTRVQVRPDLPGMTALVGPGLAYGFGCVVATDIKAAGGGGSDGLFYFSGAGNLFVWIDRQTGVVGMVWAQALPYQAYPMFVDVRRAVAGAVVK